MRNLYLEDAFVTLWPLFFLSAWCGLFLAWCAVEVKIAILESERLFIDESVAFRMAMEKYRAAAAALKETGDE